MFILVTLHNYSRMTAPLLFICTKRKFRLKKGKGGDIILVSRGSSSAAASVAQLVERRTRNA